MCVCGWVCVINSLSYFKTKITNEKRKRKENIETCQHEKSIWKTNRLVCVCVCERERERDRYFSNGVFRRLVLSVCERVSVCFTSSMSHLGWKLGQRLQAGKLNIQTPSSLKCADVCSVFVDGHKIVLGVLRNFLAIVRRVLARIFARVDVVLREFQTYLRIQLP